MEHTLLTLIEHSTLPLTHRVRAPSAGNLDGAPCLVLLHGVGANERSLIDVATRQDPRLTVILARGPVVFGPNQFGWFTVNFTPSGPVIDADQAEQARAILVDFVAGLPTAYGCDPSRIWIAGFSQGGIMSASVALTRPELVAGFGVLSGRILPEVAPLFASNDATKKLHAIVSHGVQDAKLQIHFARNTQQLLIKKEVKLTYEEYDAGHELNETMQRNVDRWIAQELKRSSGNP